MQARRLPWKRDALLVAARTGLTQGDDARVRSEPRRGWVHTPCLNLTPSLQPSSQEEATTCPRPQDTHRKAGQGPHPTDGRDT